MTGYVGQQFGDFRLIYFLGRGTFGDVYQGKHIRDGTLAAVKVLQTRLTNSEDLKQFINEARTFRLKHPHIVQLLDFGIGDQDIPFLIMDYAPNGTLRQRHPRETRVPLAMIVSYVKQIASALQYAHDRKLIHRDVKPDNILLGPKNEILVSDFGIAVVAHSTRSLDTQNQAGTVPYMAPEQIQGKPRPASDQYALGIMVYEWICGERPFNGSSIEIAMQHALTPPPSLRTKVTNLDPEIEQVVMIALAKDPQQRFVNIQAFATALEQAIQPPRKPTGTLLWTWQSKTEPLQSLAWAPDSIHIASANERECNIWNINHPNDHKFLPLGANTLTWIQDGRRIATKQKNKMLLVDVKTGTLLSEISVPFVTTTDEPDRDHIWSSNGLYISYIDGRTVLYLNLFNIEKGTNEYIDDFVITHSWSPDGHFLGYIDFSHPKVAILDTQTGNRRVLDNIFKDANGATGKETAIALHTRCLALSPNATLVALENTLYTNIQIWDVSTGTCIFTKSFPKEENYDWTPFSSLFSDNNRLVWSPNCKYLARKVLKEVQIWDIRSEQQIFSYQRHANIVQCVAWSPDGTRVASTSMDGILHIWQAP